MVDRHQRSNLIAGRALRLWHVAALWDRDASQHRPRDQAMKRQDGREVETAKQVVRQHKRGRRNLLAASRSRNIHNDAEIEVIIVKAQHHMLRSFAQHRKQPDHPSEIRFACAGCFQAKRRYGNIAQPQKRIDPAR